MKKKTIYIYRNIAYSITKKDGKAIDCRMLRRMTKQRILSIMSNASADVIIKRRIRVKE